MSLSPSILRRVKQLRAQSVYPMPITTAVAIARFEARDWSESEYPFVADLANYGHDSVTGNVGPFTVTVRLEPDEYAQLGEDDVTGWFSAESDQPEDTVKCSYWGWNSGRDARWYHIPRAVLDLPDYYRKEGRKSAEMIADLYREAVQQAQHDDADRSYYVLDVTVELDSEEVGRDSLCGIDILSDGDSGASYLRECAIDLIGEALRYAEDSLPKAVARAEEHAAKIRALIAGDV